MYLMKVILNVPDEGYSSNVPDEGYSRNASCALTFDIFIIIFIILLIFIELKMKVIVSWLDHVLQRVEEFTIQEKNCLIPFKKNQKKTKKKPNRKCVWSI
jgi:hypothetical protein